MLARLTLQKKDGARPEDMALGQSVDLPLKPSTPVIIGRSLWADLRVDAPGVGQKAVSLCLEADRVWLHDLGSGGGSTLILDGGHVDRPNCILEDEATLAIGAVVFHIELIS